MRKRIIWAISIVLLLAAGGAAAWFYTQNKQSDTSTEDRPPTKQEKLKTELIQKTVSGDVKESDAALESAINEASSDEESANLYLDRAAYRYYTNNVTDEMRQLALADAEKAYELYASASAAKIILDISHDINRQDLIDKYQPIFDEYTKNIKDLNQGAQE